MKLTLLFPFLCLPSLLTTLAVSSSLSFPQYLTHGHFNPETNGIDVCESNSAHFCDQIDFKGRDEIWFFWGRDDSIAKLFIENTREKYQIDQRYPDGNQWRNISPALNQAILSEIDTSLLTVSMTNVKFTDLVLGFQTLWFEFSADEIVPTVIHCYDGRRGPKCVWTF